MALEEFGVNRVRYGGPVLAYGISRSGWVSACDLSISIGVQLVECDPQMRGAAAVISEAPLMGALDLGPTHPQLASTPKSVSWSLSRRAEMAR